MNVIGQGNQKIHDNMIISGFLYFCATHKKQIDSRIKNEFQIKRLKSIIAKAAAKRFVHTSFFLLKFNLSLSPSVFHLTIY